MSRLFRAVVIVVGLFSILFISTAKCPQNASSNWHEIRDHEGILMKYREGPDGEAIEKLHYDSQDRLQQHSYYDWRHGLHTVLYNPETGDEISHDVR